MTSLKSNIFLTGLHQFLVIHIWWSDIQQCQDCRGHSYSLELTAILHSLSTTEANQLILFREIITVWLCGSYKTQNSVLLSIEANGSRRCHCVTEG